MATWLSALAFTRRNLTNFFLSRFALVGVLMVPMVLLIALGTLYSRAVDATGISYMDFLVPGICMQAAMFAAIASAWTLAADRVSGFHRAALIFAGAPQTIVSGRILTDLCKYGMALIVIVAVGVVLGFRIHCGALEAILALVLLMAFAAVCSLAYVAVGCRIRSLRLVEGVTMAPFPVLFLLSTAISPLENYPSWLQPLIHATPVSVVSEAVRGLLEAKSSSLLPALLWLAGASAVFGVLALRGLRTFREVS